MFSKLRQFFSHEDKNLADNRLIFVSMLIGAVLSLMAAFVLSVDAVELARNPDAQLSCSVNIIVNCATVSKHPSATLFGFPNSFLGLMAEPIVITVAIAGLAAVKFPRKFMFVAQICYSLGFIFAYYLFYISMFVIQALCPWCLLVLLSTTFVFFSMTRYNIREDNLYLPDKIARRAKAFIRKDYDKLTLAVVVVAIVAGIILKYGAELFA
ncbi:MAG: vitamin K epoxide reductase family protein [Candidatus Saccharibacteria bacterium]